MIALRRFWGPTSIALCLLVHGRVMADAAMVDAALERTHTAVNLFKKYAPNGSHTLTKEELGAIMEELASTRNEPVRVQAFLAHHPPAQLPATFETLVEAYNSYVDWALRTTLSVESKADAVAAAAEGAGAGAGAGAGDGDGDDVPRGEARSTNAASAAIAEEDADALEEALRAGSDPNGVMDGEPLVCKAAAAANVDLLHVLIDAKADVNARREADGMTPLMILAEAGEHDGVELLLGHGADTSITNIEGKTASQLSADEEVSALINEAGDNPVGGDAGVRKSDQKLLLTVKAQVPRRVSVSAESVDPTKVTKVERRVVEKSEADKERIRSVLNKCFLFKQSDAQQTANLVDAMYEVKKAKGEDIIKQGERDANEFFIIDSGTVDVFKGKDEDGNDKHMISLSVGSQFGELALMYNTPRAATVRVASDEVVLWAMDRESFKNIVLVQTMQKRLKYESFLEQIELLKDLSSYERSTIADSFEHTKFSAGSTVIVEGDVGDNMYLLVQGKLEAYASGNLVASYETPGAYFGELALLNDETRRATVNAVTDCELVALDRAAFERLMGPVKEVLKRNAVAYEKFVTH